MPTNGKRVLSGQAWGLSSQKQDSPVISSVGAEYSKPVSDLVIFYDFFGVEKSLPVLRW